MEEFKREYNNAVEDILEFFDDNALDTIGRHNVAWKAGRFDLRGYLSASAARYEYAYNAAKAYKGNGVLKHLDVGGFFGAFPVTLRRLGHDVTIVEKYSYYYGAFDELKSFIEGEGVTIVNADYIADMATGIESFDIVYCLAVLEHLSSSPATLMGNIKKSMNVNGITIIDVPNIAYWPNRLKLLKGETIHPPLQDVYESAVPFVGHHREYTMQDLERLLDLAGFVSLYSTYFNYTPWPKGNWKQKLVFDIPLRFFDSFKEVIFCVAAAKNEDQ